MSLLVKFKQRKVRLTVEDVDDKKWLNGQDRLEKDEAKSKSFEKLFTN